MTNTKLVPYLKLSIGIIAAVTAIDECLNSDPNNSGDWNTFLGDFDWEKISQHAELALLTKAIYSNEVSKLNGLICIGRHELLASMTARNLGKYAQIQLTALMPAITLMKDVASGATFTADDLCATFSPNDDSLYLNNETYGRLIHATGVIKNLLKSMENRRKLDADNISVQIITHIIASAMVFGKKQ